MDKKQNKNLTRIITGIIGFPLIVVILIFGDIALVTAVISIVSIFCCYEYNHCFKSTKKANPTSWLVYLYSVLMFFTYFCDDELFKNIMLAVIPVTLLVLFTELIIMNGKKNVIDSAVTLFEVCYIPMLLVFFSRIMMLEKGKILIWYVFAASWGSDVFAYFVGRKIGKHKYTSISPNKSIEGAVAGIVASIIIGLILTVAVNNIFSLNINYLIIAVLMMVLCVIGQIGDLVASSIKRYCGIKDFSNLLPGHGGMLDRMDSVIFILPFAYLVLEMLI